MAADGYPSLAVLFALLGGAAAFGVARARRLVPGLVTETTPPVDR